MSTPTLIPAEQADGDGAPAAWAVLFTIAALLVCAGMVWR